MQTILTVLHLFLALGLIGLVLIQHGRGADAGAAFGSGASATVFGARGSGSFLSRATAILAALFFVTSMALAYFAAQVGEPEGLMEGVEAPAPLAPGPAAPLDRGSPSAPAPAVERRTTDVPDLPGAATPEAAPTGSDVPAPPAAPVEADQEVPEPAQSDRK